MFRKSINFAATLFVGMSVSVSSIAADYSFCTIEMRNFSRIVVACDGETLLSEIESDAPRTRFTKEVAAVLASQPRLKNVNCEHNPENEQVNSLRICFLSR